MKIGAQLYTLHEYTKTLEGFEDCLKKVADMGYRSVQVSGTCAYEPEWLAAKLKENGLTCDLTHYNVGRILNESEKVVEEHKVFGCRYIGVGSMPGGADGYADFLKNAPSAGEKLAANGALLMYHNHNFEYLNQVDGKPLLHDMAEKIPAGILGFTLDTHWVKAGGYDPVEEIRYFSGRLPCVHYKDMIFDADGTRKFAPVGYGVLEMEKITEAFLEAGTEYAFVEQDDSYGESPFENLKKSLDYLRSLGLKD